jgi:hypothetical protein
MKITVKSLIFAFFASRGPLTNRSVLQLGTAKNANEMFRIFSRFNALFVRPHIRGAIREYQTQLIQRVKVILLLLSFFYGPPQVISADPSEWLGL